MKFENDLKEINQIFSARGIKIRIEKRGSLLSLRGPLPSLKNKDEIRPQRISLNLPANLDGLKKSEKLLELLLLQLQHNQFQWDNWRKSNPSKSSLSKSSINEAIEGFKFIFFKDNTPIHSISSTRTTWTSAYKPYLKRLQQIGENKKQDLTTDLFLETLSTYQPNSRSRQLCCSSLGVFARHLNIKLPANWRKLGSGYSLKNYGFRNLPDDDLIKKVWSAIPNPRWKLVYGLMACYGLRNHEVFFSDFSSIKNDGDNVLRVLNTTKTGEHQVWPFHPEWIEVFGLTELSKEKNILPLINTDLTKTTLQGIGRRVSEQFRRYNIPMTPYDLRHAWAIRTIHIGLPDTVSARMMGHSVSIHNRTYHHWITKRDQQKAVDAALSKRIS